MKLDGRIFGQREQGRGPRKRSRPAAAAASLVLFSLPAPSAADSNPELDSAIRARLDAVVAPLDGRDRPGCGVAAMRSGRIVYQRAAGMADLERGVPIKRRRPCAPSSRG